MVRGSFCEATLSGSVTSLDGSGDLVDASIGTVDEATLGLPLVFRREGTSVRAYQVRGGVELSLDVYDSGSYLARTPFKPEVMAHLGGKRVFVLGVGSVGSALIEGLAKAGVGARDHSGCILFADPDVLEPHNLMRHELGAQYLGWNKALAMQDHLRRTMPGCAATGLPFDPFLDRASLRTCVEEHGFEMLVAASDDKGANYMHQLLALADPSIFVSCGCFDNAAEGECFVRVPGRSPACYEDLHPPRRDDELQPSEYDYSTASPGRYAGEPALGSAIFHKTSVCLHVLLGLLLLDAPVETRIAQAVRRPVEAGAQYVRIGGPHLIDPAETGQQKLVSLERPWEVRWFRVRKEEACGLCGDGVDPREMLFGGVAPVPAELVDEATERLMAESMAAVARR
jgi:molybdopterin/thiamine biosynthesis adenylyltransferase